MDTVLVLHALVTGGPRRALRAAVGIAVACLVWGAVVVLGLGALLTASVLAFNTVKWAGAVAQPAGSPFWRGFLTNVLKPKVGVFRITLRPQFMRFGLKLVVAEPV